MSESVNQVLSNLKISIEGPVCLSLPESTPIYQCENGHIICNACHQDMAECPQCHIPFGKIRNLLADSILEAFTKPCPFAKHGCAARLQIDRVDDHKQICSFREFSCPLRNCDEKLTMSSVKRHLIKDHANSFNTVMFSGCGLISATTF